MARPQEVNKSGQQSADAPHSSSVADTGLSVVYQPKDTEPILDIILVHGLQGHPFNTWAAEGPATKSTDSAQKSKLSRFARKFIPTKTSERPVECLATREASGTFWPKDLLPKECPQARILVFGYNTTVAKHPLAGSANKNSIFAHSKDFINELCRNRPQGRPTAFVTHSLGGILIKETLAVCSTSNSPDVRNILEATAGIIFMGTPHRGSSAAGIGEIARKAASALLMDTNALVLDSLALKNADLERCQHFFSELWLEHGFEVKTFQEGLPLRLPFKLGQSRMVKIVPDASSSLGDARERAEVLDGDHRSICRFTHSGDTNFRKVAAELRRLITEHQKQTLLIPPSSTSPSSATHIPRDRRQDVLEALKFPDMLFRQLMIATPARNTCQWLYDLQAYKQWQNRTDVDLHHGLLQLTGKPGSGKSTLLKSAFETMRSIHQKSNGVCVVGHFFSRGGGQLQNSQEGMLRSILYQLCTLHPPSVATFDTLPLETIQSTLFSEKWRPLQRALRQILSHQTLAPKRTIIFVDALDECNVDGKDHIGYLFAELTRDAHKAGVQLDVFISNRAHQAISIRHCLAISIEAHNDKDIQEYVRQRLETVDIEENEQSQLQDNITKRSNGIFLWTELVTNDVLKGIEKGAGIRRIINGTQRLPEALEDLFALSFQGMKASELQRILRLFQWAILSIGHLRIREWHHILPFLRSVPPKSLKEWKASLDYTEKDSQLERQISSLSRGLIEVKMATDILETTDDVASVLAGAGSLDSTSGDSRVIQPIHESVTEYFLSGRANAIFGKDQDYNFSADGHLAIMEVCLDYIMIEELDDLAQARGYSRRIAPRTRGLSRRSSNTSFMSSASSHSGRHRQDSGDNKRHEPPELDSTAHTRDDTDFATILRSSRALSIRHDTSMSHDDTDLVLRAEDPKVYGEGVQVLHLQIKDLVQRKFSLHRYSRSGPEWCTSEKVFVKPTTNGQVAAPDTGFKTESSPTASHMWQPKNLIWLEFYQHLIIELGLWDFRKRQSYLFTYAGTPYAWEVQRRTLRLTKADDEGNLIAQIRLPNFDDEGMYMDANQSQNRLKPCDFWLATRLRAGNSLEFIEIIIGTGMVALVDDRIRRQPGFLAELQKPVMNLIPTTYNPAMRDAMEVPAGSDAPAHIGDSKASMSSLSLRSQLMEENPALMSYALNRMFDHACAGNALKGDYEVVCDKLSYEGGWLRWWHLQQDETVPQSWQEFFESIGLRHWILEM